MLGKIASSSRTRTRRFGLVLLVNTDWDLSFDPNTRQTDLEPIQRTSNPFTKRTLDQFALAVSVFRLVYDD